MPDHRGSATAFLVVCALLLVTACGQAPEPRTAATPSVVASATPTEDPDANGSLVPKGLDISTVPTPKPRPDRTTYGADVSWPQCPKGMGIPQKQGKSAPMPTDAAEFVVLGLTNSPNFTRNPCLDSQLAWVRERHLWAGAYSIVTFPDPATLAAQGAHGPYDGSTRADALSNVGYHAAQFNTETLKAVGLHPPVVWIDVEPVPYFAWSDEVDANAAVVRGAVRGYTDAGLKVGFYSTPSLWKRVVGGLRIGGPEWRAAGSTSEAEALRRCATDWSFQGGPGVLGQWVEDGRDRNVTCPGAGRDLGAWFSRG